MSSIRPLLLLLLLLPAAPLRADDPELARLVEALASDDAEARAAARERIAALPADQQEGLRRHLSHQDPDVRFQVLALLGERDARVEARVREIVEGRASYSGTHEQALQARAKLLEEAAGPEVRAALARVARRRAGTSALAVRYVTTSLDLLAEALRQQRSRVGPADAAALVALLEVDLGEGMHGLAECFAALPGPVALPALRGALAGGSTLARARAARVLGEAAGTADAPAAAQALTPLLAHEAPVVRLAAIRALGTLPLPDEALVPAAALARDQDPEVAEAALGLAGERRLQFAREAAERCVADDQAPPQLRRTALRALGLLGHPGSAQVLRKLAGQRNDPELCLLAAWALAAVRAPDARPLIESLAAQPELAPSEQLYFGLARMGGPEGLAALEAFISAPPLGPDPAAQAARRIRAVKALGALTDPPPGAVDLLVGVARGAAARRGGDAEVAVRALGRLGTEGAREGLARLARTGLDPSAQEALHDAVIALGPPKDATLRGELTQHLIIQVMGGRTSAAMALVRVDPVRAREVLTQVVRRSGVDPTSLEVAHALARCGDTGPVRAIGLPYAREQLRPGRNEGERINKQNALGIELLYAAEWDQAILEFRRMLWCEPLNEVAAYNVACGHSLAGRADDALRALRRSIRHGYGDPNHMASDSDLDTIRGDPRFIRIMAGLRVDEETGIDRVADAWPAPR